jgi:hypothetical protein
MYKYESIIALDKKYKKGKEYQPLCPFHGDSQTGSFSINLETGLFNCFSCHEKGNIIDYINKVKGFGDKYYSAAKFINEKLGYNDFKIKDEESEYYEPISNFIDAFDVVRNLRDLPDSLYENKYLEKKFGKLRDHNGNALINLICGENSTLFTANEKYKFHNQQINKGDLIIDYGTAVQIISTESKQFLAGSKYIGSYWVLEDDKSKPYIIAEGIATALSYYQLGYNCICAGSSSNIIEVIKKFINLKYKLFISIECDDASRSNIDKLMELGVNIITFDPVNKENKKGYDANDFFKSTDIATFKAYIDKQIFHDYNYYNYLKSQNIRVYSNTSKQYIVVINNVIYKCSSSHGAVINTIIENTKWFNNPAIKDLKKLVERYVLMNTLKYDELGYNPS